VIATRHGFNMTALAMFGIYVAPTAAGPMATAQPKPYKAARGVVFAEPARATFTSEKPLTKRQKRRLRGKAKS